MAGRPSARILSVAALTAAILGLAGCYGQTDLATHVGPASATLNARGAANGGPAQAWYEYWKDSAPDDKLQTPAQTIPDGANGPFPQKVAGLANATRYSFRLCGKDASVGPVCAQTRSFITGAASVQAYGSTAPEPQQSDQMDHIDVNVASGPVGRVYAIWRFGGPGGPPGGISFGVGSTTTDNVTCLNVQGNVAAIGFRQVPPYSADVPLKNVMHAYVVDGGPPGSGQDRFLTGPTFEDEDPNDCTIPADVLTITHPLRSGEASISP
jgi:hypothetical protein